MVRCAKVKREDAEKERKRLAEAGALDNMHIPMRGRGYVYFPLVKGAKITLPVVQKRLARRSERPKTLRDALAGKLTARESEEMVTSFDLVGDIAVVEVPDALRAKEKLIAKALMGAHHNVKVVAKKVGGTSGEFRIRPVEVIAGEKRTRTVYREGGCEFELDLNEAYFSPRLGTERGRLCAQVKPQEKVIVPFAGVGPFAIRMGKAAADAEVVGVELNPEACAFFRRNVERNKCGNVRVLEGDVAKLLPGKYAGWADRAAMPLPKDAKQFLANVIPCLKKGGILHYYSFGSMEEPFAGAEKDVQEASARLGRKARIVFRRVVRPYSKDTEQVAVDAEIL
ncbi:MAG: class I SAM-dependent methyltransferase family protein [Candidatus Micrarchaeota archaeon]|nr:class I SAM-dependent methyltransferase family protein [Candidatus Micrarchaeota archaeon]